MRESTVEKYFVSQVKKAGGEQRKVTSPGHAGVADRIVGFAGERFAFVELKAPGKPLKPHQAREAKKWIALGFAYLKIDTKEAVDNFIWQMTQAEKR